MKVVKLVSGGVDSYILSQEIDGINLYIDFGQPYAKEEMSALDKLGVKYEVIKIDGGRVNADIFIPDRNLTLACLAAMLYQPDVVYMAGLKDDNCSDKNETEFGIMSDIVSRYANKRIEIRSPYWQKTKGDIVREFTYKDRLRNTFSCYTPKNGKPCGNCPACLRRTIALETNGVDSGVELSREILKEYASKIHKYDADRISRFFIYLRKHGGVLAVDIDGILCKEEDNLNFEERAKIGDITEEKSWIILFTSRLECDRQSTEKWLLCNNIKYDALIMNKLPYDLLIDDRTVNHL